MGDRTRNGLFPALLFTGLGCFAWFLLAGYTDLTPSAEAVLGSGWVCLFLVVLFNALGFLTLRVSAWLNRQYVLHVQRRWKVAAACMAVLAVYLLVDYGFLVVGKALVGARHPFAFSGGGVRILLVVWLVEVAVLGLLLSNRMMAQTLRLSQRAAELQAENNAARYAALQSQLNPHFLFNNLNALIAEIEYDPARAVSFTRNLSEVYRYVLQAQSRPLVSLGEELRFADAYLYLHVVRLGECLRCRVEVTDEERECRVPPLTLQLLIENVVKHNTITASRPMEIVVATDDGWLTVSNPIRPRQGVASEGVGLRNLSNRCRIMLGREIEVLRTSTSFTVKVPMSYE